MLCTVHFNCTSCSCQPWKEKDEEVQKQKSPFTKLLCQTYIIAKILMFTPETNLNHITSTKPIFKNYFQFSPVSLKLLQIRGIWRS